MKFKLKHPTHFEAAVKFFLLVCILITYLFYLIYRYDTSSGVIILALTWSFFVLCTPIADAGFLIDFPIRILFGLRMLIVEIFVWILALTIVITTIIVAPEYFSATMPTRVLYQILTNPIPYWLIILLSFIGTFASIFFGDEMIDVLTHDKRIQHHKHSFKHRAIVLITTTCLIVTAYYILVKDLNVPVIV